MSLLKLLTTGKSLVGLKDSESRYRMTNQRLLPKFGAKNPFREADAGETVSTVTSPPMEEQLPASTSPAPEPATAGAPVAMQGSSLLRLGTAKARNLANAALQNRWASQLKSLISRPARKPAKVAVVPAVSKLPMQGELSLDRIKVVRNDLSDADLEIVSAKPKARVAPRARVADEPAAAAKPAEQEMLSAANR
jgi:hypothetical protein